MRLAGIVVVASGCVVTLPASEQPAGTVVTPQHGSVAASDTVAVSGTYDGAGALDVQVLADPTDLTSWTAIGSATVADGMFAANVQPAADQWPAGGVLRLRVVDFTGAPLAAADDPNATTIAIARQAAPPAAWTYLVEKPPGSSDETAAYYTAIDAPATLADFQAAYGFPGDEHAASYYNAGDLGIGRDMHCRGDGSGAACYVSNYGTFGGDQAAALDALAAHGTPLATVAMTYTPPIDAPNAVAFIVYGPDGKRVNQAQLDTVGNNVSIPQNCLNCHGGSSHYDASTHAASGARWLPFDPGAFAFDTHATLDAQQTELAALDAIVAQAGATSAEQDVIAGLMGSGGYDATFVPAAWASSPRDAQVYRDAIAPYCRSCHASFPDASVTFATPDGFRAKSAAVVAKICSTSSRGMPTAQQTTARFFTSGARALLLSWLDAPGACAPQ